MNTQLSQAAKEVLAERQRQIEVKGYTHEHDDSYNHLTGRLVGLALERIFRCVNKTEENYRICLVEAAALLLAEIERIDRKESKAAYMNPVNWTSGIRW
ncbi:MAG: hypothetical protein LBK01_01975 [Burkholderiaceae bacterium]|jgi:hypothetical protein|nr:hypothetical protein [Burkholderiaceae bacterium]